jgi:hypothetical protein
MSAVQYTLDQCVSDLAHAPKPPQAVATGLSLFAGIVLQLRQSKSLMLVDGPWLIATAYWSIDQQGNGCAVLYRPGIAQNGSATLSELEALIQRYTHFFYEPSKDVIITLPPDLTPEVALQRRLQLLGIDKAVGHVAFMRDYVVGGVQ